MSALKAPQKISKRQELRQDQVVTAYARAWSYFDKNRKLVYGILAGLILAVLLAVAYFFYLNRQNAQAEVLLAPVQSLYAEGMYREALDGSEGQPGLIEIAREYGRTDAGNLARFYAADALYRLGEYDQALEFFRAYDKDENFIGASALAGEAAIYENREEYGRAAQLYRRAASYYDNELTAPRYLLDAARASELAGELDAARTAYEEIRSEYPESEAAASVDFFLARLEARTQANS